MAGVTLPFQKARGPVMAIGTIVFVPGICGSEIRASSGWFGEHELWLNPPALIGTGWGRLRLTPPSEGGPPSNGTGLTEGGPLIAFYGTFFDHMRRLGWEVVAPRADWRRGMLHDVQRLNALVQQVASAGWVYIVAHSRGGLLVRHALAALNAVGLLARVRRVVGIGVPHGGSLGAVQYLDQTAPFSRAVYVMGAFMPGHVAEVLGPSYIASVTCSWESLYELMPHPNHGWIPASSVLPLYSAATWAPINLPIVPEYLAPALASWGTLPAVPASVDWVNVVGTEFSTPWRIPSLEHLGSPGHLIYHLRGDGLVHADSATLSGRRTVTLPTAHDWLPQDSRLWPILHDVLLNGLTDDVVVTGRRLGWGV